MLEPSPMRCFPRPETTAAGERTTVVPFIRRGTRYGVFKAAHLLGTFDTRAEAELLLHPGWGRHVAEVLPTV